MLYVNKFIRMFDDQIFNSECGFVCQNNGIKSVQETVVYSLKLIFRRFRFHRKLNLIRNGSVFSEYKNDNRSIIQSTFPNTKPLHGKIELVNCYKIVNDRAPHIFHNEQFYDRPVFVCMYIVRWFNLECPIKRWIFNESK